MGSVDRNFIAFPSNLKAFSGEHLSLIALPLTVRDSLASDLLDLKKSFKVDPFSCCSGGLDTSGKIGVKPIFD
jgi:hypothetical protein